jgi:hypothetical protein
MLKGITFQNIWHDEDMYEFKIISSDGTSTFINEVYVGYSSYAELIAGIDRFKSQVYGGIYDIVLGAFGPEYANGAFTARLHFQERGKIYVSIHAQSEFADFGKKNIASEAKLFFITEPALLDNFIQQLIGLKLGRTTEASLQIVQQ